MISHQSLLLQTTVLNDAPRRLAIFQQENQQILKLSAGNI